MADTCDMWMLWKIFKVIWVEVQQKKKFFFFKKKNKVDMRQGKVELNLKFSKSNHTNMQTKKKNFKYFKNISSLPLKSMG